MEDYIFFVGDVDQFTLTPTLGGAPWNMTGGTVTFYLRSPTGVIAPFSATIVSPGTTAQYVCTTSDLSSAGSWERWWKVVVGGIQKTYLAPAFPVQGVP